MPKRNSNNGQRRVRKQRRSRSNNQAQAIVAPAPFQASLSFSKKFRFSVTAATTGVILNAAQICRFITVIAGTGGASTDSAALIDRFRIRKIELFGPMTQTLVPVTVKLEYFTSGIAEGFVSSSKLYSDTSMSSISAAHLNVAPDEESLASKWVNFASSVELVRLQLPAQSIVDITLDIVLNDGGTAQFQTLTVAGTTGTVGTLSPTGWTSLGLPNLV